jgi:uncharacterized membrane protein
MDGFLIEVLGQLLIAMITIVPLWKIFDKAGKNPAVSLFVFIPYLGLIIVGLVLAFSRWPSTEGSTKE